MIFIFREQEDGIITMSLALLLEAYTSYDKVVQDAKTWCEESGEPLLAVLEWPDEGGPRFLYAPPDAETRDDCRRMATRGHKMLQREGKA